MAAEVGASEPERPVYVLGESFGAVLALAVAARRPDLVDRLVLVNPATAFQRSVWPRLGPLLPRVPKVLLAGPAVVSAVRMHDMHVVICLQMKVLAVLLRSCAA